jgi:hypothetical protein
MWGKSLKLSEPHFLHPQNTDIHESCWKVEWVIPSALYWTVPGIWDMRKYVNCSDGHSVLRIATDSYTHFIKYFKYLFFDSTGIWTQDPVVTKQIFYHFDHAPSPFCLRLKSSYL